MHGGVLTRLACSPPVVGWHAAPNPSIERTPSSRLRQLSAAHVECYPYEGDGLDSVIVMASENIRPDDGGQIENALD